MKWGASFVLVLFAWFTPRPGWAAECTRDSAVRAIAELQSVVSHGDQYGFPTWPTSVADGPDGRVPYIEKLPADGLTAMERSVVRIRHQVDVVRDAIEGRCGEPSSDEKAGALVARFDPWLVEWESALPRERRRRATDASAAGGICEALFDLDDAQPRLGWWSVGLAEAYTRLIEARKRLFLRDRKKPFRRALCPPPPNPMG